MNTLAYGGCLWDSSQVGIAHRHLINHYLEELDIVASSDISILIKYYTDWNDVDEDLRTISLHGGFWSHDSFGGFCDRSVDNSGLTNSTVASSNMKN